MMYTGKKRSINIKKNNTIDTIRVLYDVEINPTIAKSLYSALKLI